MFINIKYLNLDFYSKLLFYILHSVHYSSVITFWTNESGNTQLDKTFASCFLYTAAENSPLCNIYAVDRFVHWKQ